MKKESSLKNLFNLKNKTAIIVGGSGYIGESICHALSEQGCNLVIASRDINKCKLLSEKLKHLYGNDCLGIKLDILKVNEIDNLISNTINYFGKIDILVNNAWSGKKNSFESITLKDWNFDMDICLNSVFYTIKKSFPYLKKTKGVIINTASMYGHVSPDYRLYDGNEFANPPSYGAAKAGVIQLTKYLASFLSPHNIRVNAVSPGPFPFPETMKNKKFIKDLSSKNMLNRVGYPDELKGVYALLASDASSYITGQNICVDGGWASW